MRRIGGKDSRVCPKCGSRAPFGFRCPNCMKPVERGGEACPGCGRKLMVPCFYCGNPTFAGADKCDFCGRSVMIRCENKRCGEPQFFDVTKCMACGKIIKKAKKQINNMRKGAV